MPPTGTLLCVASFEKGHDFLREAKALGWRVLLLTTERVKDAAWPWDAIDERFFVPDDRGIWKQNDVILGVSHLARRERLDRIVPLDDLDLEMAAALREHLRVAGMGETTTRHFRDKLAMRHRARDRGIRIPAFTGTANDSAVAEFLARVPPPWVLKPRQWAGSIGVQRIDDAARVWALLEALGDQRSFYLLEQFIPGDIFHVDGLVHNGTVRFARACAYARPPLEVSHHGGIFVTRMLEPGAAQPFLAFNAELLQALGLQRGACHTEIIRAHGDGQLYFLETAARVGGAHIADLVQAATGVNLWREWARVELAGERGPYEPPVAPWRSAGLLVSLARQEWPDLAPFDAPEVAWRLRKHHHVGLAVVSDDGARVDALLAEYAERVQRDFHAELPPASDPTSAY